MKLHTLIAAALLAAATLSTAASFGDYEPVGFLSDYSRLQHKAGTEAYSWSEPAAQISAYDKVMVDRIKVYLKADAGRGEIDPATMQALAQHFHDAILKALGGSYQVTREPGPRTLRLRVAVTDLVPNKPEASVITLAVPFGGVAEAGVGALSGKAGGSPFIGHASVEIEALDSQSHQQVAAYIETRAAKKFDVDLKEGVGTAVGKGVTGYADSFSTWAYTKKAMDHWADLIGAWLKTAKSS
ncbi:DUF3313 domain-containing protein [Thiohalocapsa sp.]|uniref:DUF3313 domain-containing protein n=1 Tax=Thiohalocapsa sp. TaxID=2497641 RepID=UPI0025DDCF56|nr:DUF3313 domain-containing protein [Thiohalocapsa sp.]